MFAFYLFVVTSLSLIAFYIGMLVGLGDLAREAANEIYWVSWPMVIRNISYALVAGAIWVFSPASVSTASAFVWAGRQRFAAFLFDQCSISAGRGHVRGEWRDDLRVSDRTIQCERRRLD
jgi:hypothetical protein